MVAISGLHWTSPLLLTVGGFVIVWSHVVRAGRIVIWGQTPDQRRQEYMSRLLTERRPAAEVRLFGLGRHYWRLLMGRLLDERMAMRRRNVRTGIPSILITTVILGAVMLTPDIPGRTRGPHHGGPGCLRLRHVRRQDGAPHIAPAGVRTSGGPDRVPERGSNRRAGHS